MRRARSALLALLSLLCAGVAHATPKLELVGLFKDRAVLVIDGQQRLLRSGQTSPEGVLLVSADTSQATVRFKGVTERLSLSQRVSTSFARVEPQELTISADELGQYRVRGAINGHFLTLLVDTGASVVALSSATAERLGIDYLSGEEGVVETANGRATSYFVVLDQVTVGEISRRNVRAAVVRGFYPTDVLLGMSFLGGLRMTEQQGVLSLSQIR
ncbi:MAG: TIGR02281 family clan AA aspartic protease [Pseudomonadota bacterium]